LRNEYEFVPKLHFPPNPDTLWMQASFTGIFIDAAGITETGFGVRREASTLYRLVVKTITCVKKHPRRLFSISSTLFADFNSFIQWRYVQRSVWVFLESQCINRVLCCCGCCDNNVCDV